MLTDMCMELLVLCSLKSLSHLILCDRFVVVKNKRDDVTYVTLLFVTNS